jgi:hypothetical protein
MSIIGAAIDRESKLGRRNTLESPEDDFIACCSGGVIRSGVGSFGGGGNWNTMWKLNRGLEEQQYDMEEWDQ